MRNRTNPTRSPVNVIIAREVADAARHFAIDSHTTIAKVVEDALRAHLKPPAPSAEGRVRAVGPIPEVKYGWFSAKAADHLAEERYRKIGVDEPRYPCIYEAAKGGRVVVTMVTATAEDPDETLVDDLRCAGAVYNCVRDNMGRWLVVEGVQQWPVAEKYNGITCPDCGGTETTVKNRPRWPDASVGQVYCICGRCLQECDAG